MRVGGVDGVGCGVPLKLEYFLVAIYFVYIRMSITVTENIVVKSELTLGGLKVNSDDRFFILIKRYSSDLVSVTSDSAVNSVSKSVRTGSGLKFCRCL